MQFIKCVLYLLIFSYIMTFSIHGDLSLLIGNQSIDDSMESGNQETLYNIIYADSKLTDKLENTNDMFLSNNARQLCVKPHRSHSSNPQFSSVELKIQVFTKETFGSQF